MKKLLVAAVMAVSCVSQTSSLNAGLLPVPDDRIDMLARRVNYLTDTTIESMSQLVDKLVLRMDKVERQAYIAKWLVGGVLTAAAAVALKKAYDHYQAKRNAQ